LLYEATETGEVEVDVRGATHERSRVTEIRHAADPAEELTSRIREGL
jgi:hypothetical protein